MNERRQDAGLGATIYEKYHQINASPRGVPFAILSLMKTIILLVFVLGIAVGGYFLMQRPSSDSKTGSDIESTVVISKPYDDILITAIEQSVTLKSVSKSEEVAILATTSPSKGDTIKTSATGRALVESPKGHPTILDYSSELTLVNSEDEGNKTSFELFTGGLWSRAKKSAEKGEFYEIKTGNAVAVVRGTSFGLTYKDNITTLLVTEGSVSIYNIDPKIGKAKLDTEVVVTKDKKAIIKDNEKTEVEPITDNDKKSDFFKLGNEGVETGEKKEQGIKTIAPTTKLTPKPTPTPTPPPAKTTAPETGSLSPSSVKVGDNNTYVVLTGRGFNQVTSLSINESVPPDFQVIDDTTIRFHIGRLTPEVYDLYLVLDDGSFAGSYRKISQQLTVTQ